MGSIIMHLTVSNIIKEKYNLSDAFLAGSIMPDIYNKCKIPREITHFITIEKENADISRLPNLSSFLNKYSNNLNNETLLGYFCHLIEDRVWFREFIPKYAKITSYVDDTVLFLYDKTIHKSNDFPEEIYKDYAKADHYLTQKYNINIPQIKENIIKYYNQDYTKEALKDNLYLHNIVENRENMFLTQEDADLFIKRCLEDIEKYASKYLINLTNKN